MKTRFASRQRGFSLVELMISVVIGLLALMFAVRLMSGSNQAQRAGIGSSDSMQNGMVALFSMSRDAGQAGFGLNDPIAVGCDTVLSAGAGYALAPALRGTATVHPLGPVVIESNGQDPDRITFYSGSSMGGTGSLRTLSDYSGGTSLDIDRPPFGFGLGDVVLVAPEQIGGQCALAQLSADPNTAPGATKTVQFAQGGDFPFNGGQLNVNFAGGATRVFDLGPAGSLGFHTWSVDTGVLKLSATDVTGSGQAPASVADNIVSIKAQYGLDTRSGAAFTPASGMQVNQWSSTMISADGDSVVGTAGDYARIAAVRIAVVARSKAPDAAGSGGCTATTAMPVVFSAASGNASASPVTVNVAVSGDSVDWRCYHYRVFETIVPLRNFGWRP
jgi:type IV pilus assembly protein PilW